jgi:hypothetical protein
MRLGILPAALLAFCLVAGCASNASTKGGELVVESQIPTQEVESGDTVEAVTDPVVEEPKKGTRGHIAGVVVDQAIRPIQGATVRLPGMDLTEKTDRNGAFSFADLHVGPYLINANATTYYGAETVITVKADEFSRVKFVLTAIPPPEPRHVTQKFEGFADVTDLTTFTFLSMCTTCYFDFYAGGEGLQALLIEATMDPYAGVGAGTVGSNNFYLNLRDTTANTLRASGDYANPMRVDIRVPPLTETESAYRLNVRPEAFPVPETNKDFEVFVTQWYNSVPPIEWSFVNGDT